MIDPKVGDLCVADDAAFVWDDPREWSYLKGGTLCIILESHPLRILVSGRIMKTTSMWLNLVSCLIDKGGE
jgi:hypothetical protein